MKIKLINDDIDNIITKEFVDAEAMRMWIAERFEKSPYDDGVYYEFTDTGTIDRYRLEIVK